MRILRANYVTVVEESKIIVSAFQNFSQDISLYQSVKVLEVTILNIFLIFLVVKVYSLKYQ